MSKKVKIELEDWDHTCGDGCCYTWGTNIKINGQELDDEFMDVNEYALKAVLEHLGYTVEIDNVY